MVSTRTRAQGEIARAEGSFLCCSRDLRLCCPAAFCPDGGCRLRPRGWALRGGRGPEAGAAGGRARLREGVSEQVRAEGGARHRHVPGGQQPRGPAGGGAAARPQVPRLLLPRHDRPQEREGSGLQQLRSHRGCRRGVAGREDHPQQARAREVRRPQERDHGHGAGAGVAEVSSE